MGAEDYLKEIAVGGIDIHNREIDLHEYDQNWPLSFRREADKICGVLGEKVLRVEHVGSTSVPGLCAKPILDILLLVEDSAAEDCYVGQLEAAGYRLRIRETDWYQHRLLRGQEPAVNLHVFSQGCEEADRMLAFRDHLRTNDDDRELYAQTKRRLAMQTWKYVQDYANAKTGVVQEIMSRALAKEKKV